MDDLISRQAAIKQILLCENHDMEHDFEFNEGLIVATNAVEELPTAVGIPPHGRLIDADEAIAKIAHGEYVTMVDKYGNSWMMPGTAIEIIADAPTIIEAEGRENE